MSDNHSQGLSELTTDDGYKLVTFRITGKKDGEDVKRDETLNPVMLMNG